jgi:hypothetical protein
MAIISRGWGAAAGGGLACVSVMGASVAGCDMRAIPQLFDTLLARADALLFGEHYRHYRLRARCVASWMV